MKEYGYLIVKGQKKKIVIPLNSHPIMLLELFTFSAIFKGISNNNNHKNNKLKGHIS